MNIATILFTYNRSWHTSQVLDALSRNTIIPENLIIIQDGLKNEEDKAEWSKVKNIIKSVTWSKVEIVERNENYGLSRSIIDGLNEISKEYDSFIVLEDDCVPDLYFIEFMYDCLKKYKDEKKVFSVSGYSWPIEIDNDDAEVYFCGRISSWGWGTWNDRWNKYKQDYSVIKRLQENKESSYRLALWGGDLENILISNLKGESNSWGVFWALTVIENGGYCLNPYKSLIKNIGFDGSGVHCRCSNEYNINLTNIQKSDFRFPDNVEIKESIRNAFVGFWGSTTVKQYVGVNESDAVVYGLGNFFSRNEKEVNRKYNIVAFVDRKKSGYFAGKKIIHVNEIVKEKFDKILIMLESISESMKVALELYYTLKVDPCKIVLGCAIWGEKKFDKLCMDKSGSFVCESNKLRIPVVSVDEYNNVYEVFVKQIYNYILNNGKKDIVFDVGTNIGDSTLYFLNRKNVLKVYGFEPFKETYLKARNNCIDYINNKNRLEIFQYGLGEKNTDREITFSEEMSCAQSTILEITEKAYSEYILRNIVNDESIKTEIIKVKRASEVLSPLIDMHKECNFILKMNCEGEEYGIIKALSEDGILHKIDFIMLEWHYKGSNDILKFLDLSKFSYWCIDKNQKLGWIYAYRSMG